MLVGTRASRGKCYLTVERTRRSWDLSSRYGVCAVAIDTVMAKFIPLRDVQKRLTRVAGNREN